MNSETARSSTQLFVQSARRIGAMLGRSPNDGESSTWRVGVLFSRIGVTRLTETGHFLGTALAVEDVTPSGAPVRRAMLDTASTGR